jgi:hypothetical protein
MLYGLRRSPKHWYNKIRNVLLKLGFHQNACDPCLFSGNIIDPSDPTASPSPSLLTLELYVDNFIYFLKDPDVKAKFAQCHGGFHGHGQMVLRYTLSVDGLARSGPSTPQPDRIRLPPGRRQ